MKTSYSFLCVMGILTVVFALCHRSQQSGCKTERLSLCHPEVNDVSQNYLSWIRSIAGNFREVQIFAITTKTRKYEPQNTKPRKIEHVNFWKIFPTSFPTSFYITIANYNVKTMQGCGFVNLPSLLYHPYLVCTLFGMSSPHSFTFLMFCNYNGVLSTLFLVGQF